ncbi:MAG: penicillin-binding protein [Acidobacteriota bacterium]
MPPTEPTRRLHWLLWGLVMWSGLLFGRLVWLQVFRHDELLAAAENQQQKVVELPAMRGAILDRTGQPLAMSLEADSVVVDPQKVKDLPQAARLLGAALGLNPSQLLEQMKTSKARGRHFMWVARKLDPEVAKRVRELKFTGLEFHPEMRRFYPGGSLAAHLLGATGIVHADDVVERGNAGVELSFERELGGKAGEARLSMDSRQNSYDSVVLREPIPGADLTLTIDPTLQYRAERELEAAVRASGAKNGSVVALDPYTGDVLAMANYPSFDPNLKPQPGMAALEVRQNLAVSKTFEPGSVFKVITLAAALENTTLTPQTMIDCGNGKINLFGRVIHDHDSYSALTMAGVLAHSSNIGAIRIAMATGERNFYEYQKRFGFGAKTGIPLPGESGGILWPIEKWTKSSIGSLAMGHELGVTAIQLALAGVAVANGGMKVKPRLVISRQRKGQEPETVPQAPPVRILKPETAVQMRQMMEGVVLEGTGRKAVLQGYTSGGKTGSAQIYDPSSGVYTHTYNASFLGFAPVGNPRVVIAVTLYGTTGGSAGFGGARAAPVFREVAMGALRMLDVPKDLPDRNPRVVSAAINESDLPDAGANEAPLLMAGADLSNAFNADALTLPSYSAPGSAHGSDAVRPRVVSSVTRPPADGGTPVLAGDSSVGQRPFFNEVQPSSDATKSGSSGSMPDFRGMTLRAVYEKSAAMGLNVEAYGSGLARSQDPLPGAALQPRAAVKVQFGR